MDTKVTTMIVNDTNHGSTMKVGNRNFYSRLASVKIDGKYMMQIDVNWTYQEFLLEDKSNQANQLFINSDDCCDYERIKEINGKFDVQRDLRKQFRRRVMSDPSHDCKGIPCSYCGKDYPKFPPSNELGY